MSDCPVVYARKKVCLELRWFPRVSAFLGSCQIGAVARWVWLVRRIVQRAVAARIHARVDAALLHPGRPRCAREVEKRKVRGEPKRNREAGHRGPRALRDHGYKCGFNLLFFGLEGRAARESREEKGERRAEEGRRRRSPESPCSKRAWLQTRSAISRRASPRQRYTPARTEPATTRGWCRRGAMERPFGCGLGTRRSGTGLGTRPQILAQPVFPGLRPGSLCSPGLAPGYARSPAPRAAIGHGQREQVTRAQDNAFRRSSPFGAHRATPRPPTRRIVVARQTTDFRIDVPTRSGHIEGGNTRCRGGSPEFGSVRVR